MSNLDFSTVVPAAQRGDHKAQNALMEKFYGWSVTQAKQVARDHEIAADIAVEFWDRLLRQGGIKAYDNKVPFLTWMRVRLRSQAIDWVRANKRPKVYLSGEVQLDETVEGGDDPLSVVEAEELWERVQECLTPGQRNVMERLMRGEAYEDIAEALGVEVQSVYDTASKARARIRDEIGD